MVSHDRRRVLKSALALASAAALSRSFNAVAADGEISIGFCGPVTGPFAELGTAMRDGALVAVEHANTQGGVRVGDRTYQVKLVVGDEENVPERAVAATRRLIEVDKVMGILGYAISTNLLAAMQLLQDSKIPMIDTSASRNAVRSAATSPDTRGMRRSASRIMSMPSCVCTA